MDHRIYFLLTALSLTIIAGCNKGPSTASDTTAAATNSAALSDPAAQVASDYLDALVKGDTPRALQHYTPQATVRMKEFPLPGFDEYSFRVTGVERAADDKALVACRATIAAPDGQPEEEEVCLLLQRVDDRWRVSGMAFDTTPNSQPTILSFEAPERGPIPLGQWLAETRAADGDTRPSPPRAAQEQGVVPAGAYR